MRSVRHQAARGPQVESLFIGVFVLFAFRLGSLPIADNSMLTHLRTGIDMVAGGGLPWSGIPSSDPYSFTAAGHRWLVQSWLASWSYGVLHELGGARAVVAQQAVLMAALAWMMARLARCGSPVRTALAAGLVIGMASGYWSPRPLLFGLLGMAATVNIVERRRSAWLLVPVVWLWANAHGSYPLGLVWLVARAVGEWRDWRAKPSEALRYTWYFAGALLLAALGPLGPRLLLFPLTTLQRQDVFSTILEWQSPNFQTAEGRLALACLAVTVVVLARFRLTWRDAVPAAGFIALALLASRNLPVAAVVLAPVLGRALRAPESARIRPEPSPSTRRIHRMTTAVLASAAVLVAASVVSNPGLRLAPYPEEAVDHLEARGLISPDLHMAHQDGVGNYLELRYGNDIRVFIDDRYDMYPVPIAADYHRLLRGAPQSLALLDDYGVEVVLWQRNLALATVLDLAPAWDRSYEDSEWVVFTRAPDPDGG